MDHGPEGHGIGDLPVEPDVLIGREGPGELGTDDTNDVSQHREEDKTTIVCKNQASTSRGPNGEPEGVQASQSQIRSLGVVSARALFQFKRSEDT